MMSLRRRRTAIFRFDRALRDAWGRADMKLLLCKTVEKLGIVGDVVNVKAGYARNYLLPSGIATEPTEANVRALAEARRIAEQERIRERELLKLLARRIEGVEITIPARANEDGVLYGSVGRKDISAALRSEGHPVVPEQVALSQPIRHLDNLSVDIRLADDLVSSIKVWVVRDRMGDEGEFEAPGEEEAGTEAGPDDKRTDNY
jgi:large subunit ribosomal protein L9